MDKKFTPFLKPNEVLLDEQIDHLREKSDLKGIGLLAHAWMIILLSIFIFSIIPNIFTYIAAVIIIARRQHGISILMQ